MECLITPYFSSASRGNVVLLAQSSFLSCISSKVNLLDWKNKLVERIYLYVSTGERHTSMLDSEFNLNMRKDNIL